MKWERVLHSDPHAPHYFNNPLEKRKACHELTAAGKEWAERLLAEARAGRKPWLLDAAT
jgi:hypothetical protein